MNSSKKKNTNILEKRIPVNPKFKDVKPVVDTGASITTYMAKLEDREKNYRYRKDEIFKRMKLTTFVQLLIQVADINSFDRDDAENIPPTPAYEYQEEGGDTARELDINEDEDEDENLPSPSGSTPSLDNDNNTRGDTAPPSTARSCLSSVIRGVGEIDIQEDKQAAEPERPADICPYLLLDVRTEDEFNQSHLISALNYPSAMLSRSVNYETKELLNFKNQPGKIIILYDEDERIAHKCSTTFVERGYDNVFLLSGGLKVAYNTFPNGLITGTVPASISPLKKGQTMSRATKTSFSDEDMMLLAERLDTTLLDKTDGRSTRATTRSGTVSQISNRTTSSVKSKPIFKP